MNTSEPKPAQEKPARIVLAIGSIALFIVSLSIAFEKWEPSATPEEGSPADSSHQAESPRRDHPAVAA